ncbi:hypothetical protein G9A89_023888 [Geosiphon pyriformis]|nr:hypothetical protein G9A89_023888 [Geosiphon pyriformis]
MSSSHSTHQIISSGFGPSAISSKSSFTRSQNSSSSNNLNRSSISSVSSDYSSTGYDSEPEISSPSSSPTSSVFQFLPNSMIESPRPESFSLPPTFALDIEIPHFALRRRNAIVEGTYIHIYINFDYYYHWCQEVL